MGLETVILREVSQTERQIYDTAYMWSLKNGANELIYKAEKELRIQKSNLWLSGGQWGRDKFEDWG